jgi:hypothetical protein
LRERIEGRDGSSPSTNGEAWSDPTAPLAADRDWRGPASAAQTIRVTGTAFTARIRLDGAASAALPLKKLRKACSGALRTALGDSYEVERLEVGQGEVIVEVTANSRYRRASRLLSMRSQLPWPVSVDSAVEEMRRAVRKAAKPSDCRVEASWRLGRDVWAEEVELGDEASAAHLQDRRRELTAHIVRLEFTRLAAGVIALVVALLGVFVAIVFEAAAGLYVGVYGLLALLVALAVSGRLKAARSQSDELNERIELGDLLDDEERRAFRLFRLHNLDLRRYYDLVLSQRRLVFGLGAVCVLVGAGIALVALLLIGNESADGDARLLIAGVAAVGAILSNFVAVVYLRMFRDTVNSMNIFHTRLVATHHLLFGNLLSARIQERVRRDETLAAMASSIAHADRAAPDGAMGSSGSPAVDGRKASAPPATGDG